MISAWAVHENRAAHARRPAREGAAVGLVSSFATRSDHAPTSLTGTNAAAGPPASRRAGMSLATTAAPHARASITGSPNPSASLGISTTPARRLPLSRCSSARPPERLLRNEQAERNTTIFKGFGFAQSSFDMGFYALDSSVQRDHVQPIRPRNHVP